MNNQRNTPASTERRGAGASPVMVGGTPGGRAPVARGSGVVGAAERRAMDGSACVASVVKETERPPSSTATNSSAFWNRCSGTFAIIFLMISNSVRLSWVSMGGVGISSMMCL